MGTGLVPTDAAVGICRVGAAASTSPDASGLSGSTYLERAERVAPRRKFASEPSAGANREGIEFRFTAGGAGGAAAVWVD